MQIALLNTSKNYKQHYLEFNHSIYSVPFVLNKFKNYADEISAFLSIATPFGEKINPYKYPKTKDMQILIDIELQKIFAELKIQPIQNVNENFNTTNTLINYILLNSTFNMMAIEDRLLSFKGSFDDLKEHQEIVNKVYDRQLYEKDKTYRRAMLELQALEKHLQDEKVKMLFDLLVRKQSVNQEDSFGLMYVLKQLGIESFKLNLANKNEDDAEKTYSLLAVLCKRKANQPAKYYLYDTTEFRFKLKSATTKQVLDNKIELRLLGQNELTTTFLNHEIVSIENLEKTLLSGTSEYLKLFKEIEQTGLDITYQTRIEEKI
ncbi:MAG: hypothetical protein AB7S44_02980 [Spirochaetales bacterium]